MTDKEEAMVDITGLGRGTTGDGGQLKKRKANGLDSLEQMEIRARSSYYATFRNGFNLFLILTNKIKLKINLDTLFYNFNPFQTHF